jgi:ubiquinone/menaquinone biosynthesis C-methylase UbiE
LKTKNKKLLEVIQGMKAAFANGENAMAWCRKYLKKNTRTSENNELLAILIAYDLQAGAYVASARKNKANNLRWCKQIFGLISQSLEAGDSLLEVGVGEATTLAGVLEQAGDAVSSALGFDISWSRLAAGKKWLEEKNCKAQLFVGDLLNIPLEDNAIDVIYSSHSLEPNRGKEVEIMRECLRIARKAAIFVEPIYELATSRAQARMRRHGYVRGLKEKAKRLGAKINEYRLLEYSPNPMNPSGVLYLKKNISKSKQNSLQNKKIWRCPITKHKLSQYSDFYYSKESGFAYPVFQQIPMLRSEHAILATKLKV